MKLCIFLILLTVQWTSLQTPANYQETGISNPKEPEADYETIEIKLQQQQIVDKGRGISQVFVISEDGVIHHAGKAKEFVKPPEIDNQNLAYCRIYFIGRNGEIEKGIMVLVVGFDTTEPTFYVDQNNNLDFTDDGKPDVTRSGNGYVLSLSGDDPDSEFAIKLIPFHEDKKMNPELHEKYRQMFQGLQNHMGGQFADVKFWYYNQRLNTRTNSVNVEGQKVMIGLHDYDCDGLYSGKRDRLLVGEFEADWISYAMADGAINVIQDEIFLIGKQPYRLVDVADNGSWVRIKKSKTMPNRLFVGNPIPDIELRSFDGESIEVKKLIEPDKLLVLDFWGHWCAPCVASIPSTIAFHDKWKDKIRFIGVHSGDHSAAKKLIDEKKIPFRQFETSETIEQKFFIDSWPSYVVVDPKGNLLSFRSSLKEIAAKIENGEW